MIEGEDGVDGICERRDRIQLKHELRCDWKSISIRTPKEQVTHELANAGVRLVVPS